MKFLPVRGRKTVTRQLAEGARRGGGLAAGASSWAHRATGTSVRSRRAPACGRTRFRLVEKRQSRVDGQVCPSTLRFRVRPPVGSPYETSTNRLTCGLGRAVPAADVRVAPAFGLRRLVQVSSGWSRAATALDLRAVAGSRAAGGRAAVPRCSLRGRVRAAARAPAAHFFSVCCAFVGERAVSCAFFAVCCRSGRARGAPPPASPSKTAGQTNDDEMAYRKEGAVDGPNGPERVRIGLQSCNKPKKMCTKLLSADARLARRPRAPVGGKRLRVPAGCARACRRPRPAFSIRRP